MFEPGNSRVPNVAALGWTEGGQCSVTAKGLTCALKFAGTRASASPLIPGGSGMEESGGTIRITGGTNRLLAVREGRLDEFAGRPSARGSAIGFGECRGSYGARSSTAGSAEAVGAAFAKESRAASMRGEVGFASASGETDTIDSLADSPAALLVSSRNLTFSVSEKE